MLSLQAADASKGRITPRATESRRALRTPATPTGTQQPSRREQSFPSSPALSPQHESSMHVVAECSWSWPGGVTTPPVVDAEHFVLQVRSNIVHLVRKIARFKALVLQLR